MEILVDFGVFLCLDYCKTIARKSANTGEGFGNFAEVFGEDMGVNLGHSDTGMTEELLDLGQVNARADQVERKRALQTVQNASL